MRTGSAATARCGSMRERRPRSWWSRSCRCRRYGDYGGKRGLYAALGVAEYWICDVGGIHGKGSPLELEVFRLGADGLYAAVSASEPANGAVAVSDVPAYWRAECGVYVRLMAGAYEPCFQWWDGEQGRWRDTETEAQDEKDRIARTSHAEGRVEMAIAALHFLPGHLYSMYGDEIAGPLVGGRAAAERDGPHSEGAAGTR